VTLLRNRGVAVRILASSLWRSRFRGKARLLNSLAPRRGEYTIKLFDYIAELDLRDLIQRQMFLGTFEPNESALVSQALRPGMTFVDVGANVGHYTLLAAAAVGDAGHVFAFEPGPYAYARLRSTVEKNKISQVMVLPIGLSDVAGTVPLFIGRKVGNYTPTMIANEGGDPVDVVVRTLDECLDEFGVDRVDVLKIDVEGYELRVLKGAMKALRAGRIRALLCEFNDPWLKAARTSSAELYEMVTKLGFEEHRAPATPHDVQNRFFTYQDASLRR
jgi:FkbM family methyltransferase